MANATGALINGRMFGTFTSVSQCQSLSPDAVHIFQNYPNPFNASTTMSFSLRHSAHATLTIYNLLGQEITILLSDQLQPGTHLTPWDASNVASGVYYYRLGAGDFVQTRKLMLLK